MKCDEILEKISYFEICSDVGIVFSLSQSRISTAWSFGRPIGLKRKLNFEFASVSTCEGRRHVTFGFEVLKES